MVRTPSTWERVPMAAVMGMVLIAAGAPAAAINIPNGERLLFDGHLWYDVTSPTPRPSPTGATNAFGAAYTANPNWATLCPLDSDGDGFTNGEELGDPNCVWVPGAKPARTTMLSHPGLYSSVPVDAYPMRTRKAATCARDADSAFGGDGRVALRSQTLAAPRSIRRLTQTQRVASYRLPEPDTFTEDRTTCPHLQANLKDWHDPATWGGGGVPAAGTAVTLPAATKVLVSSCSLDPRGYLTITVPAGSQLIFADAPIFLRTKDLDIRGSLLLGSSSCPLHSPVTISFTAEKGEGSYTNGATARDGGAIRMHGTRNSVTWTRLAATVLPGTSHLLLQQAVGWGPGDEIVVATSTYLDLYDDQNERRTVVAVSSDGMTVVVDRPFAFKHWASIEYQTEVGLLTRSIVLRGGLTATAHAAAYGGHTMAASPGAVLEMVGVRAHRMGQQNVLGRYSFHMHMLIDGSTSSLQQSTCDESYYRCVSIHKTNGTLIRKNVAFRVAANCYYMEDGSEMFNHVEYNLAVYVLPLGRPAAGGAQGGEIFNEDETAIQPADHAAAGFYISNPHNYVIGNAASGGWAGFAFPIFPYAQRLSSDLKMNPSAYPILEFDGNTAHSSGYYWGDAGCIYFGGRLTEVNGKFMYENGRYSHPTIGYHNVTNLRTWLCNRGLSSWGERVEMSRYEAHDVKRSAVLFGQSSIHNMIVTGTTLNNPVDMRFEGRQGFGFYDTWVQTTIVNATFINFWDRGLPLWNRDAVFADLSHSDIFKPWYISATRNLRMHNVDRTLRVGRWVRDTGASRMFNIVDWDGTLAGRPTCEATIIGSDINWWDVGDDCWFDEDWPAWVCPRKAGREVVGIDVDLPGIITQDLDYRTDDITNNLTEAQRAALYIGHMSQFGSRSDRQLIVTRNHHVATGISGMGWYLYLKTGVPEQIKVWPQNFATTGTSILLAISYPAGTTFDLWAVPRWTAYKTRLTPVASRQAVVDGNGTMYHFDGRHLYLKVSDLWSPSPNAYVREGVSIPNVMSVQTDFVITAVCSSKNAQGFCTTPAKADPPTDLAMPVRECNDPSEQTTPITPTDLCPQLTDEMPPEESASGVTCAEHTVWWNVWRCTGNWGLTAKGYCKASCTDACRVYNPYPHRCSFMEKCIAKDVELPRLDVCGEMNEHPMADECTMRTCDADTGNLGHAFLAAGAPCNYNSALGVGVCDGNGGCVLRTPVNTTFPAAARITDRVPSRTSAAAPIQLAVSLPNQVTAVTATLWSPAGNPTAVTLTRVAAESTSATAIYEYSGGAAGATYIPRRSVDVTLTTTLAAPNNQLTFSFKDWNAAANVVPSVSNAKVDTANGQFSVVIDPIDWVSSAVLYHSNTPNAVTTPLTCDYSAASSSCNSGNTNVLQASTPPTATAYVALTMATGVTVKRTLPCLLPSMLGSSCLSAVHTVRSLTTCRVSLVVVVQVAWWLQVGVGKGTTLDMIKNISAVGPGNIVYPLTLQSWGQWNGGAWADDAAGQLRVYLADGGLEVFAIQKRSTVAVGDTFVCVSGTLVPPPDEVGTAGGTCAAVSQCAFGALPPAPTATTPTTSVTATTTSSSTTSSAVATTTSSSSSSTTSAAGTTTSMVATTTTITAATTTSPAGSGATTTVSPATTTSQSTTSGSAITTTVTATTAWVTTTNVAPQTATVPQTTAVLITTPAPTRISRTAIIALAIGTQPADFITSFAGRYGIVTVAPTATTSAGGGDEQTDEDELTGSIVRLLRAATAADEESASYTVVSGKRNSFNVAAGEDPQNSFLFSFEGTEAVNAVDSLIRTMNTPPASAADTTQLDQLKASLGVVKAGIINGAASPSTVPSSEDSGDDDGPSGGVIIGIVVGIIISAIVIGVIGLVVYRKWQMRSSDGSVSRRSSITGDLLPYESKKGSSSSPHRKQGGDHNANMYVVDRGGSRGGINYDDDDHAPTSYNLAGADGWGHRGEPSRFELREYVSPNNNTNGMSVAHGIPVEDIDTANI